MAAGLGAEGAGDSDDHQDGGEAQDQVWPVLARTRGWVAISLIKILIEFLFSGTSLLCGLYNVETENIENYEDFIVTDLKVTHTGTGEERWVQIFIVTGL